MSLIEIKDDSQTQNELNQNVVEGSGVATVDKSVLIPLNANASAGPSSTLSEKGTTGEENGTSNSGSPVTHVLDTNGNKDPGERGATSDKKRSKRPPSKPSPALLLAKQNAQMKKRNQQVDVQIMIKDHLQPARDAKENVRKQTGVVYDLEMLQHFCLWDPNYPENPERLSSVIYRCEELGLLGRSKHIEPRLATRTEILTVHTEEHIEKLQKICENPEITVEELERHSSNYDAIYLHPTTYNLSLLAAGSTIDLVNNVLNGHVQNGMAIIRPPGHHAMKAEYCGYCYFNNVAIAAKKALEEGRASKILIVDFDVHHGQATQQAFYDDPRVLYFSTHRFEHGMFWPNLEESNFNYIGASDGIGFNCNVPLNKTGMGNSDFLTIWHQLLLPMAYQFNPDLVIVSAGYDAALGCMEFSPDLVLVSAGFDSAIGDEKGEMEVTPACYPHFISPLMGLAGGKIAVILEGGYCLKSLAEGAALTLKTLLGDSCPEIPPTAMATDEAAESILNATYMLKSKWSHLISQIQADEGDEERLKAENKLHLPEAKYLWKFSKPETYETRNCYPEQSPEVVRTLNERLDRLILTTSLQQTPHRVAIVYDDLMLKHRNSAEPGHPERPERISNIFACHGDFGLLERCHRVKPREATEEELLLIHTPDHIRKMKGTQKMSSRDLYKFKENFNSIYFNNHSFQCALVSAGSILQVMDSVLGGECRSGAAIVRPPGHHAEIDEPCGFCLFNNVALAAQYGLNNHGLKKILILDWDVHHGNGIQHIFDDDPRVLYISLHRYDYGGFFPCSEDANYDKVGSGRGEGYNVNIPWNKSGMGDTEYLSAFLNVVMPIAYEYGPELVLVSAGFDAAKGDPLGGCKVTPEGYAHMTHLLSSLANGRIIVALEGGYNLTAIAYSMTLCTKALLGDPIPSLQLKEEVDLVAVESIRNVLDTHAKYWSVLKPFRKQFPFREELIPAGKYHKVVEESEIQLLQESFHKSNLDNNNSSFESSESSCHLSEKKMDQQNNDNKEQELDAEKAGASGSTGSGSAIQLNVVVEHEDGAAGGGSGNPLTEALKTMQDSVQEGDLPGVIVQPKTNCPHVTCIAALPEAGINVKDPCNKCNNQGENWICLVCYTVCCSRYVKAHMVEHAEETGHKIALSFADLSVWCYGCDDYIDHSACRDAKASAHVSKFGTSLTGSS